MTDIALSQTAQELLDYTINWATRGLGTDTIASSSWSASDPSVTLNNESFTNTTTTFWLTGGVGGNYYAITNTVTTAGGRTMQETITYECLVERLT